MLFQFRWLASTTALLGLTAIAYVSTAPAAPTEQPPQPTKTATAGAEKPPVEEFAKYLSGTVLSGVFTIDGQPLAKLQEERYEIKTARKIDGYDSLWEIVTRIKYGDKDIELPVEINVEWVGKTPVMVMDSVPLPGLGTFSARVVFHDKKYAGTWKHDEVGGHLFGRVDKAAK